LFEVKLPPARLADLNVSNRISTIRPESVESGLTGRAGEETSWTAFVNTSVIAFNGVVNGYGGYVNSLKEVVVEPGERRAVMVECVVPTDNNDDLINTVNQKQLMALASRGETRRERQQVDFHDGWGATSATRRYVSTRTAIEGGASPVNLLREIAAEDLAKQELADANNFYVQASTPTQSWAVMNAIPRTQEEPAQDVETGGFAGIAVSTSTRGFFARRGPARPSELAKTAAGTVGSTYGLLAGGEFRQSQGGDWSVRLGGRGLGALPPGANFLYFVLEPNMPLLAAPPPAASGTVR
jgi:hypothetical protein